MMPMIDDRIANRRSADAAARFAMRSMLVAACRALLLLGAAARAQAQVVAIVNGEPITARRHRAAHAPDPALHAEGAAAPGSARRTDRRQAQGAARQALHRRGSRSARSKAPIANIARRAGMTPDAVHQDARQAAGISADTLKARIHADFVWSQIVRGKFQGEPAGRREGSRRQAARRTARTDAAGFEYHAAARSCSWCRAARRRPPSRRASARPKPCARASRAATRACASRWRCPTSRCASRSRAQSADLGAAAARHAQQDADRPADAARRHAAGRRDVRGLQQDAGERRRHAGQARGARRDVPGALSGAVEEVSQGTAQPGADRDPIGNDATAGADARRAGRDRSGHHARRLAEARRARAAAVLSARPIRTSWRGARALLGLNVPIRVVEPRTRPQRFRGALPVVALAETRHRRARPSRCLERAGRDRLDPPRGRRRVRRARACASSPIRSPRRCSTAPASPSPATPNISPGSRRSTPGARAHPVMMLWSPELAVVPVTIHLPVRDVPQRSPPS